MDNKDLKYLKTKIENDLEFLKDNMINVNEIEKLEEVIEKLSEVSVWWPE
jgi:hypothetical protein